MYDPERPYKSYNNVNIGRLGDRICRWCKALCFRSERPGLCCAAGKVRLEPLLPPSDPALADLFVADAPLAVKFRKDVRHYNSCFQMTSFGVDGPTFGHLWSTFRVHGQIHHSIGSLLPALGEAPRFAQIYFVGDTNEQADRRHSIFENLDRSIIGLFQEFLTENNSLVREFKNGLDQLDSDERHIVILGNPPPPGEHRGRFNAPVVDEVAIVVIDRQHTSHDIVIRKRNNQLKRICETHPHYDALLTFSRS